MLLLLLLLLAAAAAAAAASRGSCRMGCCGTANHRWVCAEGVRDAVKTHVNRGQVGREAG
jgi:hypothetical protein